jgi:hypothetical protein
MELNASLVSNMNVGIITSKNKDYYENSIKSLSHNVLISFINSTDIEKTYKSIINDNDFYKSVKSLNYLIIDGFCNENEIFKNENNYKFYLQKLIYYIYSLNSSLDIIVSFYIFNKNINLYTKDFPKINFNCSRIFSQKDFKKISKQEDLNLIVKSIFVKNRKSKTEKIKLNLKNKNNFELIEN